MKNIVFINGLSCGDGTQDLFIEDLKKSLGTGYTIHRPSLNRMNRTSTDNAINDIIWEFRHLDSPSVIGFSMGGLWAIYLARRGFTKKYVSISPALPANIPQIDLLRFRLFGKSVFTGSPFRFTPELAHRYLMNNISPDIISESAKHFVDEPASLLREYALRSPYLWLSKTDVAYLRRHTKGLMVTGTEDLVCSARQQKTLALKLGLKQLEITCGHTPQFGPFKALIHNAIAEHLNASLEGLMGPSSSDLLSAG